jgi:t-SNARE complex subunit (syntaxin)
MNKYYELQSEHRDNCKGRIRRQMEIAGMKTSDDDLDRMLESGNPQIFTQRVGFATLQKKYTHHL